MNLVYIKNPKGMVSKCTYDRFVTQNVILNYFVIKMQYTEGSYHTLKQLIICAHHLMGICCCCKFSPFSTKQSIYCV